MRDLGLKAPRGLSWRIEAGLPAVVAPIGRTTGGLPVGVQIIGPLFEDETPLTFAELLAERIGGYEPPPNLAP
jgi:amidase